MNIFEVLGLIAQNIAIGIAFIGICFLSYDKSKPSSKAERGNDE